MKDKQQQAKEEKPKPQEKTRCICCYLPANRYGFCWEHDPQFRKKLYGPKWY